MPCSYTQTKHHPLCKPGGARLQASKKTPIYKEIRRSFIQTLQRNMYMHIARIASFLDQPEGPPTTSRSFQNSARVLTSRVHLTTNMRAPVWTAPWVWISAVHLRFVYPGKFFRRGCKHCVWTLYPAFVVFFVKTRVLAWRLYLASLVHAACVDGTMGLDFGSPSYEQSSSDPCCGKRFQPRQKKSQDHWYCVSFCKHTSTRLRCVPRWAQCTSVHRGALGPDWAVYIA